MGNRSHWQIGLGKIKQSVSRDLSKPPVCRSVLKRRHTQSLERCLVTSPQNRLPFAVPQSEWTFVDSHSVTAHWETAFVSEAIECRKALWKTARLILLFLSSNGLKYATFLRSTLKYTCPVFRMQLHGHLKIFHSAEKKIQTENK